MTAEPGTVVLLGHGGRSSTVTPGWPETLEFRRPSALLVHDTRTRLFLGSREVEPPDPDPLEAIARLIGERRSETPAVRLLTELSAPCCLLFLSYEYLRFTEDCPLTRTTPGQPVLAALFYESVRTGHAVHRRPLHTGISFAGEAPLVWPDLPPFCPSGPSGFELDRENYARRVERIRGGIAAGDYYVVNLSQRARLEAARDPLALWRRWALDQPMPYRAYADLSFTRLLVNSPECFLRRRGSWLETFPIKGTRRRTGDPASDRAEAEALRNDPKELAEHRMIVDLERNDFGKIARTGSVEVPVRERVEELPGLLHLVSAVRCQLPEPGIGSLPRILKAVFPGGSVTGAPKRAAIAAIDREELSPRGFYTGALLAIDRDGNFEGAMLIRTAAAAPDTGELVIGSGGGVVYDSEALREADEVGLKLEGFHRTLRRFAEKKS